MLLTMKELLAVAHEHKFAVPAFNICSSDMLRGIIEVAEETKSPVILEIHPAELDYLGDVFISLVKDYAIRSSVPIVIHLDHGADLNDVMRAIKNGYTSVMIDASHESFVDNISITKKVVEIAHSAGISVEAELGTIGNNGSYEGGDNTIIYTDPNKAVEFVASTGIDTLAIAIGTAHGLYPKGFVPKLNIELLKTLYERLPKTPFVLHGGSNNPDSEVMESVKHGVAKVNISSDVKSVFFKQIYKYLSENPDALEPCQIYPEAVEEMKKVVKHKLYLLNTVGKSELY